MANPVLSKPNAFTRSKGDLAYERQQRKARGRSGEYQAPGYMTFDDAIAKTAITMTLLVATAAATWVLTPIQNLGVVAAATPLLALITVILIATRPIIPIAGVLLYAALEGIALGAVSKYFETLFPRIVSSAVLATFITAGVTLIAYRIFNIRVTPRFRRVVAIATVSLALVLVLNLLFALFGINLGLRVIGPDTGWLAMAVSAVAVILAAMNLISDFDFIERGVAQRAPAHESWRAAFGITITMVWLYLEILNILSYFRE